MPGTVASWSPLSPVVRPQDMEVAAPNLPLRTSSHPAHRPSPCRLAARARRLPAAPGCPSRRVHPWSRPEGSSPGPAGERRSRLARRRFRRRLPPAPPGRPDGGATALQPRRSPLATPTRGPLPPCGVTPGRHAAGPRATGPPAAGVPELAPRSGPPVTSLGDDTPRGRTACAPSRGATISARALSACDFGGQKEEAAPLPGPCGHFAVRPRVSGGPHWQALCGPLVVELFAVAVFLRAIPGPGLVAGPPGRPGGCSPRQRGCAARDRDINPDSRRGFRPRPPGGIPTRFASERPRARCARGMSSSPPFLGVVPSGRTARLSRSSLSGSAGLGGRSPRRTGRAPLDASGATSRPLIAAGQAASLSPVGGGVPGRGPAIGAAACGAVPRRPTASGRVLHAQVEHRCRRISTRIDPTAPVRTMRNQIGPGRSRPHRDLATRSKRIGARPAPPRPCDARITGVGHGWRSRPEGVGPRTRAPIPRAGTAAAPPGWPACRRIVPGMIGSPAPDRRRGTDGPA